MIVATQSLDLSVKEDLMVPTGMGEPPNRPGAALDAAKQGRDYATNADLARAAIQIAGVHKLGDPMIEPAEAAGSRTYLFTVPDPSSPFSNRELALFCRDAGIRYAIDDERGSRTFRQRYVVGPVPDELLRRFGGEDARAAHRDYVAERFAGREAVAFAAATMAADNTAPAKRLAPFFLAHPEHEPEANASGRAAMRRLLENNPERFRAILNLTRSRLNEVRKDELNLRAAGGTASREQRALTGALGRGLQAANDLARDRADAVRGRVIGPNRGNAR